MEDKKKIQQSNPSNENLKLWQVSSKPLGGRPRLFNSPQELLQGALEYFKFIDEHPWQRKFANQSLSERSGVKANGVNQSVQALQRPYTLYGLCGFLGCSKWADVKRSYKDREGFSEVLEWIENQIAAQQVDGAMLKQFDGSLVARLNNIADIQINKVNIDNEIPKLTDEDLETLRTINGL